MSVKIVEAITKSATLGCELTQFFTVSRQFSIFVIFIFHVEWSRIYDFGACEVSVCDFPYVGLMEVDR